MKKKKIVIIGLATVMLFCGLSHFIDNAGLKTIFKLLDLWDVMFLISSCCFLAFFLASFQLFIVGIIERNMRLKTRAVKSMVFAVIALMFFWNITVMRMNF